MNTCYGQMILMNMYQCVVYVAITMEKASYLAYMFMEHALLKFGLCVMVAINNGIEFYDTFKKMYKALNIQFHIIAKRNHKVIGLERFLKQFNLSEKILTKERGTSECLLEITMSTSYALNHITISDTTILQSVPTIGRELSSPLDICIVSIPAIINDPS